MPEPALPVDRAEFKHRMSCCWYGDKRIVHAVRNVGINNLQSACGKWVDSDRARRKTSPEVTCQACDRALNALPAAGTESGQAGSPSVAPITAEQLLAAATEFTFRPDYGDVTAEFYPNENPADRDAVVLSYRGPSEEGGDPDRWAIRWRHHECWSRSKQTFVYEPRGGGRGDDFITDTRFTLAEAVTLVLVMLRRLEDVRIPELRRQVETWASKGRSDG